LEKGLNIVARLIFKMGIPVHVIARTIDKPEIEVYQLLNGKQISREDNRRLKALWDDMEATIDWMSR